jgi:hypothetical protein
MANDQSNQQDKSVNRPDIGRPVVPTVNWDDSNMRSTYANVVNAASTREEVTLFFGTNQTWNPTEKREFNVKLSDRIVLSPFAAKRLWILLSAILKEYETRFGPLPIDIEGVATTTAAQPAAGTGKGRVAS